MVGFPVARKSSAKSVSSALANRRHARRFLISYLLDNSRLVRGRRVLDIGCGCGASAIAAKLTGALRVVANDIDEGD
jgi:predicted nicotinamide N-methyase